MKRVALAFTLLVIGLQAPARAQDFVPGGWASEIGYQSFAAPGGFGTFGASPGGWFGPMTTPASMNPLLPSYASSMFGSVGQPLTTNGLDLFADAVRKSTRRRHGR